VGRQGEKRKQKKVPEKKKKNLFKNRGRERTRGREKLEGTKKGGNIWEERDQNMTSIKETKKRRGTK